MNDFDSKYALWDEFLAKWPIERLADMSLDEYTKVGSKESFTYWIESRLDQLGSIWGGSAFKFGVFSRKDVEVRESGPTLSYSQDYGWYSSLGATAEEAFANVRTWVCEIAQLAAAGDLEGIDDHVRLGEAFKWKIAFHYQNRQAPVIVDIFKRAPLGVFTGALITAGGMAALQARALSLRPEGQGILEFGQRIWGEWSQKNLKIWKLSHGDKEFTGQERSHYLDQHLAVMHEETGISQAANFATSPVGTIFYLCHGNSPQLIGQFTSNTSPCAKGGGWFERSYRVLIRAQKHDSYQDNSKKWSPRGISTFWQVKPQDLPLFETTILAPYFSTELAKLAAMIGDPIGAASGSVEDISHDSDEGLLRHFDGQPAFKTFRASWTVDESALFCRLARAVHVAGLDWWHSGKLVRVSFGRKNAGSDRASGLLGTVRGTQERKISFNRLIGDLPHSGRHFLTEELVSKIEQVLLSEAEEIEQLYAPNFERAGLWPDQLRNDPDEPAEADGDGAPTGEARREPINRIYYGPPGTGKTFELSKLINKDYAENAALIVASDHDSLRYRFVTFHQSYSYEEFVEGLRPVLRKTAEQGGAKIDAHVLDADAQRGNIQYEIRSGVFKELCEKARLEPQRQFAMFIDEINRGNISKIFGELITLIEADKREGAAHQVSVTLPYSRDRFSVPSNVDIIGTMNTADRSLALLDTALRRRFDFVPLLPDTRNEAGAPLYGLDIAVAGHIIDVARMLAAINQRVEALYDRDHCIGHAYFTPLLKMKVDEERFVALAQIFRNRILPLLEEYFFEDWLKIGLVLADNQKATAERFLLESEEQDEHHTRLFGVDHRGDGLSKPVRLNVQESAFSNPGSYIGIYTTLVS